MLSGTSYFFGIQEHNHPSSLCFEDYIIMASTSQFCNNVITSLHYILPEIKTYLLCPFPHLLSSQMVSERANLFFDNNYDHSSVKKCSKKDNIFEGMCKSYVMTFFLKRHVFADDHKRTRLWKGDGRHF